MLVSVTRALVGLGASAALAVCGLGFAMGVDCIAQAGSRPSVFGQAQAASKAKVNKKVSRLVAKQAKKYVKKSTGVGYTCFDLDGDGIREGIIDFHPNSGGSGHVFRIYKYKGGKLKRILNDIQYGMSYLKVYRKTKSFIMYCSGHGGEHYDYYTMKNGKFKCVACKGRASIRGGATYTGSWSYSEEPGGTVTRSTYNSIVSKLRKGPAKTTKVSKWKPMR